MVSSVAKAIPMVVKTPLVSGMNKPQLPSSQVKSYVNKQLAGIEAGFNPRVGPGRTPDEHRKDPQARATVGSTFDKARQENLAPLKSLTDNMEGTNRRVRTMIEATAAKKREEARRAMMAQRGSSSAGMYKGGRGGSSGGGSMARGLPRSGLRQIAPGQYLRTDAAANFQRMAAAMRSAGLGNLGVTRGYRSYAQQAHLYALYKAGRGNLAAPPGKSLHQSGVAVDLQVSRGSAQFNWLLRNAGRFGFSWSNGRRYGEPWHWEFVG